ncbi:MAG: hypothetical protein D3926_15325 [Desulfobacteraceae bacterium]|nr:MAG: hypothetical protein D3926_15325 [Desulfobacteraceae bacterium]
MNEKGIEGLNWGAFLIAPFWGVGNRVPKAFLVFIPIFGVFYSFVLLFKGNEWAWESRSWRDVDHFKKAQRYWAIGGLLFWVIAFTLGNSLFFENWFFRGTFNKIPVQIAIEAVGSNPQIQEMFGTQLSTRDISGTFKDLGPTGSADFVFRFDARNKSGIVYSRMTKELNEWSFESLTVKDFQTRELIKIK